MASIFWLAFVLRDLPEDRIQRTLIPWELLQVFLIFMLPKQ